MGILDTLKSITDERADNYAHPIINFLKIALMWSIEDEEISTPLDVINKMVLIKRVRESNTHLNDNLADEVGYSVVCYEKINTVMHELGYSDGIEFFRGLKNKVRSGEFRPYVAFELMYRMLIEARAYLGDES